MNLLKSERELVQIVLMQLMTNERHDEVTLQLMLSAVKSIVKVSKKEALRKQEPIFFDAEFECLQQLSSSLRERNEPLREQVSQIMVKSLSV